MSHALLTIGGGICLLNFYLSFLRYPLHRARGRSKDEFRWVSGFPVVGSALVALAWVIGLETTTWSVVAGVLILLDTAGLHWFLAGLLRERLAGRG